MKCREPRAARGVRVDARPPRSWVAAALPQERDRKSGKARGGGAEKCCVNLPQQQQQQQEEKMQVQTQMQTQMHNETSPSSSGKGRTRTSEPTTARKQDVVWGGHSEASWPPGSGFWRADTVRRARQHSIRHRSMHPSNDHTTQNTRHSHEPARFHQWGVACGNRRHGKGGQRGTVARGLVHIQIERC